MTRLLAFCLCVSLLAPLWPGPASAQAPAACVQPFTTTMADLRGRDLATVQLGLRTVLGLGDAGLDDGTLGPVTRGALRDLCRAYDFINADPADDRQETLDLAEEYGQIARVVPNWPSALATLDNLVVPGMARLDLRILRIAGPPALTTGVLADEGRPLCDTIDVGGIVADARPALDALLQGRDAASLCADLPVAGPPVTAPQVFAGLSGLQGELDAMNILQSTDFVTWLAEDLQPRLIQLAGTNAAVTDLLDRYVIERPERQADTGPLPASCQILPDATTTRYFAFGEKQLAILDQTVDVGQLLAPLAEAEGEGARSAEQLWAQMEPLLAAGLDDCGIDRIEGLVLGPDRLGLGYQLDAERVAGFKLSPDLIDSEPILAPLVGLRVANADDLIAGLRVNLTRALTESLNGQIEVAAELLAGAAEEVQESLDVSRVDPESFDTVELPPLLGITDPSVKAALDTITNEAFKRAIFEGPFIVGTNDEILKAEVRNLLRPLIADQVAQAVERDVALIQSAIVSDWRVTPVMLERINSLPEIMRVSGDASSARLAERLQRLVGIEYPNRQLFEAALRDVPSAGAQQTAPSLSEGLMDQAVRVAQTEVENPQATRVTGPFAVEDCGCVPQKTEAVGNTVYAFYPFWYAPAANAPPPEEGTEEAEAEAKPVGAPATLQPIDYELSGRVAFYGLEFDFLYPDEDEARRSLQINYLNHWIDMRRDFITSARQHRAKVDLAFDMRHWQRWSAREIQAVVERIATQMAPIPHFESYSLDAIRSAIPTLFDRLQPDAVTLIFENYTGAAQSSIDAAKLVDLVQAIERALRPRGQTVNLAVSLDFENIEGKEDLLGDLRELFIEGSDGEVNVENVLVFLERNTSDTKKFIRERFDHGRFQGTERQRVLRSIVPIVPASAHEFVFQRQLGEGSQAEAPFSQYRDDLVYFADNFAGIGFWPLPRQDNAETAVLKSTLLELWKPAALPEQLEAFEPRFEQFCTWACPRRAGIALITMAVFAAVALLVGFSYYSGLIDRVAFKWYSVHFGVLFIVAALIVLTTCDPYAVAPRFLLAAFLAVLLMLFAADFIQRMRNGPKP